MAVENIFVFAPCSCSEAVLVPKQRAGLALVHPLCQIVANSTLYIAKLYISWYAVFTETISRQCRDKTRYMPVVILFVLPTYSYHNVKQPISERYRVLCSITLGEDCCYRTPIRLRTIYYSVYCTTYVLFLIMYKLQKEAHVNQVKTYPTQRPTAPTPNGLWGTKTATLKQKTYMLRC